MSQPPYRPLRVMLGFLSLVLAIGGMLLIFSSKPLIMRMFMHPPESELSTLLLDMVRGRGFGLETRRLGVWLGLMHESKLPRRKVPLDDSRSGGSIRRPKTVPQKLDSL